MLKGGCGLTSSQQTSHRFLQAAEICEDDRKLHHSIFASAPGGQKEGEKETLRERGKETAKEGDKETVKGTVKKGWREFESSLILR